MGRGLFQVERNAGLLIEVLRSLVAERVFKLHDFVIMPDHVHLLLSVERGMTIEKAMQMVKGRFSYRVRKELGIIGEVWQRGFSEVQVLDTDSFEAHRVYIAQNPVKARLAAAPEEYPHCFAFLERRKTEAKSAAPQGLKP